ncbi:TonB-dependent receptor [Chryseobacterium indologenes]|uniref:TonB-dependent receptor plug domain-containing protein n=1 Tax=Chryseobacterium indologenes TaxID=253 RepID=UPI000F4FA8FF|nr:TonB-dependent receptor [Chryseobacterium indologenes]AYZ37936.1 TonB-dependent receptor [Chryseobacterium indologenes]MBF6646854.1 TonB-dependent receptor [Chryseobacterium indologenes]MBU3048521.1 TonB-dependent receptor [Chryseobacterium indologenes]MEB4763030.1 TonB-dependent receptor [Chryseobacterium indologenes]QQQ69492.1 TonB-dependent receptor [Chryseobacterium indologenes]
MKIKYISIIFLGVSSLSYAQQVQDTIKESKIDEVAITGSRNKKRTVINTPVPIDIIDIKQVSQSTGQVEVNQLLQFAAPSFNSNKQSGSDGADAVDPATLRGLGPDQTLLLLNGKRYHQSSLINLFGTKGRGNTGYDMNTIPIGAIKRVEVLRDGASAQYGSDAIAGVINVILNDRNKGFEGNAFYGMNLFKSPGNNDVVSDHKIDGITFNFNGNLGTQIGSKGGFGNFTAEFSTKDYAIRNANPEIYNDPDPAPRQRFGDAKAQNVYFFGNIELPLSDGLKFYSRQGFSHRNTKAYAWTRTAAADGNIPGIYPNGFNPIENTSITDFTFDNGLKFKVADWEVDFYNAFGNNRFTYEIDDTVNATLGLKSPTSFNAGGHSLLQNTTGFNAVRQFKVLEGLNIAFGSEFRYEKFNIIKGEEASYTMYDINGNIVTRDTPTNLLVTNPISGAVRPGGSQGFPGYSTDIGKSRNNFAAYVDTELDITKKWMISLAGRFENYNDFGSTLNGKFATRYAFTPQFAFRGSFSTGFRAPSLAQKYYSQQFTNFQGGKLVTIQLASNDSDLATRVGISQLKQETSVNGSAGFTFNTGKFTATVDGYYINVKNRIVLTGNFSRSDLPTDVQTDYPYIDQAQFFSNAINTRTKGIDIILSYNENIGSGKLTATLAGNYNDMEITKVNTSDRLAGKEDIYLSPRERAFILASAPKTKVNLNLNYKISKFNVNLQMVRFDKVTLIGYDNAEQVYNPKVTTDLSFGYEFSQSLNLTLGSKNIFNRYPTLQSAHVTTGNTEAGGIFDPVQMGFAGRQIFARLNFKF